MRSSLKVSALVCALFCTAGRAAPPQLYRQPSHQGPVSAEPDGLLLLAGYGLSSDDTVVYRLAVDSHDETTPDGVPSSSTDALGVASIVSTTNVPYSLTIKLPGVLRESEPYHLWVRNARGEWSRSITVNDARPLWFSPSIIYASSMPGFLPRELKIVGRNLQSGTGRGIRIKLTGPQQYERPAVVGERDANLIDHYVARLDLPPRMAPGNYRVQVSKDGKVWTPVVGQSLEVGADPVEIAKFPINDPDFGACRPNDGVDDTQCIIRAIAAANQHGGGVVSFGPGTWDLIDSGKSASEGIIVPPNVQLRGAGSDVTRVMRHAEWNRRTPTAAFTLLGRTMVSGFTFGDRQIYLPNARGAPYLQLGMSDEHIVEGSGDSASVDDVVITKNTFDKPLVAIGSGGLSVDRLFITYNTFGAYRSALEFTGDKYYMAEKFRVEDSVIDGNVFDAGSELDLPGKTGAIASEFGAGLRVDFSDNTADGASARFLYGPDDVTGWRAAFFWNMDNNLELMLVSNNTATCTADKIGDGEAISLDNNANTFAFQRVSEVVAATIDTVAASESLAARQNNRDIPTGSYYIGHWVQVVNGPGLGQARKIVAYSTNPLNHITVFKVAPAWDVVPVRGQTRVAVGREAWQVYVINNRVDDRTPLCKKSNRSRIAGGQIGMWAQSADSVIAGNIQYDTDGIFVQQSYDFPEHPCTDCTMSGLFQSFLEIRGNIVDGEYLWSVDCSASGIAIGAAAAPWNDEPPPTVGFGVSIADNTIRGADGQRGGGVSQIDSWYAGPPPHRWPLSENLLVYRNSISNIDGPRAMPSCTTSRPRIGIAFPDQPIAWNTVLYDNSCQHVSTPVGPGGVDTTRVCPSGEASVSSCECP